MFATLSGQSHIDRVDSHANAPCGHTSFCDCVRPEIPKNVSEDKFLDLKCK